VLLEAISRLQGMPHWLHYARSADMIRCLSAGTWYWHRVPLAGGLPCGFEQIVR